MKREKPVQNNQILEVDIVDLTHTGQGIGKIDGFPIFINDALPGEQIKIKIKEIKKNFAIAKNLEIIEKSKDRVVPPCGIFYKCGGCNTQHLAYPQQLAVKTNLVKQTLKRIGNIDVSVNPCIGMDKPWNYRNKTQVPFGRSNGEVVAGFFRQGTHEIIDMPGCDIQNETTDDIILYMKQLVSEYDVSTYDEERHAGLLRHVIVRNGYETDDYMVTLVVMTDAIPKIQELVQALVERFSKIKSVVLNINNKKTNTILGNESNVLYGEEYIYDYIGDVKFAISSKSFYQVNPVQTKKLYDQVLICADLQKDDVLIDAYCGIGTIGLYLSKNAKAIYGVEIVKEAIDDARLNASLNNFDNAHYEVGKAEEVIKKWKEDGIQADVIVVDPPRKGCDQTLLETISEMMIKKLVYVSCDPSTLARDLKYLTQNKYVVKLVQPVDMFPHSMHVECVVAMEYKK